MTEVTRSADCGNSPKNKAVEDLAVALEGGDWDGSLISGDTVWMLIDGMQAIGADAIKKAASSNPKSIRVDRVLNHGKAGAASGVTDGRRFAHIITFTSASTRKVAAIDSFRKSETAHG